MQNTYSYEIFDDYFSLKVCVDEEVISIRKVYFNEIERIKLFGNYLILQIVGQNYILKKDDLIADSVFFTICNCDSNKVERKKSRGILKTLSIFLFVLSICTILGALICIAILCEIEQMLIEKMWVFFLFVPVPISSIVFGFYLKKKGYKYKKNVIVGFIMSGVLCLYGSFAFIFANIYSHEIEPILNVERILDIDIPNCSQINTLKWGTGEHNFPRGEIHSTSDIYFKDSAVEVFEKKLSSDIKWISAIPNKMVGITSYYCDIITSDYYIIYNKDTKEFNKLPSNSGTYEFINILYNVENNTMKIVEYQITYTKE